MLIKKIYFLMSCSIFVTSASAFAAYWIKNDSFDKLKKTKKEEEARRNKESTDKLIKDLGDSYGGAWF